MIPAIPATKISESPANAEHDASVIIGRTRAWLEKVVIGLQLCPFAKAVHVKNQIRYVVSTAQTPEALQNDLIQELKTLEASSAEDIDTTLLIHPAVLLDFLDYNDFLDIADQTVSDLGLDGHLQIASFHPGYQFADSGPNDIENYTNRSPYPMLHLLREASVERAVASSPDTADIYENNMETMRRLGHEGWSLLEKSMQSEKSGSDSTI
jgi:hypothetical protein